MVFLRAVRRAVRLVAVALPLKLFARAEKRPRDRACAEEEGEGECLDLTVSPPALKRARRDCPPAFRTDPAVPRAPPSRSMLEAPVRPSGASPVTPKRPRTLSPLPAAAGPAGALGTPPAPAVVGAPLCRPGWSSPAAPPQREDRPAVVAGPTVSRITPPARSMFDVRAGPGATSPVTSASSASGFEKAVDAAGQGPAENVTPIGCKSPLLPAYDCAPASAASPVSADLPAPSAAAAFPEKKLPCVTPPATSSAGRSILPNHDFRPPSQNNSSRASSHSVRYCFPTAEDQFCDEKCSADSDELARLDSVAFNMDALGDVLRAVHQPDCTASSSMEFEYASIWRWRSVESDESGSEAASMANSVLET